MYHFLIWEHAYGCVVSYGTDLEHIYAYFSIIDPALIQRPGNNSRQANAGMQKW